MHDHCDRPSKETHGCRRRRLRVGSERCPLGCHRRSRPRHHTVARLCRCRSGHHAHRSTGLEQWHSVGCSCSCAVRAGRRPRHRAVDPGRRRRCGDRAGSRPTQRGIERVRGHSSDARAGFSSKGIRSACSTGLGQYRCRHSRTMPDCCCPAEFHRNGGRVRHRPHGGGRRLFVQRRCSTRRCLRSGITTRRPLACCACVRVLATANRVRPIHRPGASHAWRFCSTAVDRSPRCLVVREVSRRRSHGSCCTRPTVTCAPRVRIPRATHRSRGQEPWCDLTAVRRIDQPCGTPSSRYTGRHRPCLQRQTAVTALWQHAEIPALPEEQRADVLTFTENATTTQRLSPSTTEEVHGSLPNTAIEDLCPSEWGRSTTAPGTA